MTINREILIYQNLPFKKYRWISYLSIIQVGFLGFNLIVLPTPRLLRERQEAIRNKVRRKQRDDTNPPLPGEFQEEYEPNPDYDPSTLMQRFKRLSWGEMFSLQNIRENLTERPGVSLGLIGASILISTAFWLYAHRTIHKLTLLPDERVRFAFFSTLGIGKPPTLEVPLRNVSCVHDRKSKNNYSILKIKGYTGFHLIHKAEGQFLEPKLFDRHVAFARSWYTKDQQ